MVAWGANYDGGDLNAVGEQLRAGVRRVYATKDGFAAVKEDGSVVACGSNAREAEKLACSEVEARGYSVYQNGDESAFAKVKGGSVVAWGDKYHGGDCSAVWE